MNELTLDGFPVLQAEDASRCSTQKLYWAGVPPVMCGQTAVMLALFGCEAEAFIWGRICGGCLDTARAGFHRCVRHGQAHSLQVLRVLPDAEGKVEVEV